MWSLPPLLSPCRSLSLIFVCACVSPSLPCQRSSSPILMPLHPPFLLSGCPPHLLCCSATRHRFCALRAAAASGSKEPSAAAIAPRLLIQFSGPRRLLCPGPGSAAGLLLSRWDVCEGPLSRPYLRGHAWRPMRCVSLENTWIGWC